MVHMHNLFETVPALENIINLMSSLIMKVTFQEVVFADTSNIHLILNKNGEFSKNILAECYRRYVTYPEICIYKIKSNKAMGIIKNDPGHNSFNYKDGMVSSLHLVNDEDGYLDKNNEYHCEDDSLLGRRVLLRSEFIYINGIFEHTTIARKLERILYRNDSSTTIGEVLGISNELVNEKTFGTFIAPARKEELIKKAFTDSILPIAEIFKSAIQEDIGLGESVRIILSYEHITDWTQAWESGFC